MLVILVLSISVLLQFTAAFYALRLVKVTSKTYSWILISTALFLMGVRRLIPLYDYILTSGGYPIDLTNELIGLVLSFLMLLGVMGIGPIFAERKQAELKLEDQSQQLTLQMKELEERDEMIRKLSTPLVEVWDGVVMLPLMGFLDTARLDQVTNSILEHLATARAEIVVIDVSGIATVDTSTANYLLRTVQATRLMGSETILTGIRPDVAMTLETLGVDMSSVKTYGTLREGLKYAFAKTGFKVTIG